MREQGSLASVAGSGWLDTSLNTLSDLDAAAEAAADGLVLTRGGVGGGWRGAGAALDEATLLGKAWLAEQPPPSPRASPHPA